MSMRDFTLTAYEKLLQALQEQAYSFVTFEDYLNSSRQGRLAILRHDVDKLPQNSLASAQIEHRMGIRATYYFRIVKESNHPEIIRSIAKLGHEIGYHYEDLALSNGNADKALVMFQSNLNYFRKFYPVTTICMHGSPMSRWDNRQLWKNYSYKAFGIQGEPYFEIDFSRFCYLTDTGRRWNGRDVSVRDKVNGSYNPGFKSTFDLIDGITRLPDYLLITTHPQRWENDLLPWMRELLLQNVKNNVKRVVTKLTR
jgi:hypothetical protein